jgi:hypothetical protein
MKLFFAVLTLICAFACTKKVEPVVDAGTAGEFVNPQITDTVTQTVPVSGVVVLEEAQSLKQEVKEVLQSVSDGGTK